MAKRREHYRIRHHTLYLSVLHHHPSDRPLLRHRRRKRYSLRPWSRATGHPMPRVFQARRHKVSRHHAKPFCCGYLSTRLLDLVRRVHEYMKQAARCSRIQYPDEDEERIARQRAPASMQRGSRFTTPPVRYAVQLMGTIAVLRWLCSQSFFMVRIDGVDSQYNVDDQDQLVRLGYSATGLIALIGVSVGAMVATVLVTSSRRLGTPLGDTSMSVAISAACHGSMYEQEPWLREVQ
jgi:hypothetical protein